MVNYTLTMESATGGSITPSAGDNVYASGTEVTVTATASTGYTFTAWLRNGLKTSLPNPYVFHITKNLTLTPVFLALDSKLRSQLEDASKKSYGKYLGIPGLFYPGMDNYECITRNKLRELST